jgi:heparan-alpha-glucosaminide N-acetyltransferase
MMGTAPSLVSSCLFVCLFLFVSVRLRVRSLRVWLGVSMALSHSAVSRLPALERGYKLARRSAILFGLGLLVSNGQQPLQTLRIPGVLQRFSVSFAVVSLIMWLCPDSTARPASASNSGAGAGAGSSKRHALSDITDHKEQWLCVLGLLALHCALTFGLDVPGCGRGYLGPGGDLTEQGRFAGAAHNCTGGAAGYIDQMVLGTAHIYPTPTCQSTYQTGPYGLSVCLCSPPLALLCSSHSPVLLRCSQIRRAFWAVSRLW